MLKVLHLSSGNLYGGIETLLSAMGRLRHLAPQMDPEFGLCFRGRQWDELVATGATVYDLGRVRLSRPWAVWRARQRLRPLLLSSRPDVVVTHGCWPHAVFAPVVRRRGIRLVNFVHGEMNGRNWLERLASRTSPDLIFANSHFTAGSVRGVFPNTSVAAWHLPVEKRVVEKAARSQVRSELGTSDDAVVILQASRLERWKGQAVLLAAMGQLRDLRGWECWIAGGVQKAGEAEFLDELGSAACAPKLQGAYGSWVSAPTWRG